MKQPLAPSVICAECTHFTVDEHQDGFTYSTISTDPSTPFAIICTKRHWIFDPRDADAGKLYDLLTTARTCGDFQKREGK